MVVGPHRRHPRQYHQARGIACLALVALLVFPTLLGMAAVDATPISFKGRELDDDRSAANALGWPLPGEARPPPTPQSRDMRAWPRLFTPVILSRMVPVGWMAPPGAHIHQDGRPITIG